MNAPTLTQVLFRKCPVTGLNVNKDSERLIQINAVIAVVALLVGTVAAILLALTRWQAVHLLPADWYYRLLTAHGLNMLLFSTSRARSCWDLVSPRPKSAGWHSS